MLFLLETLLFKLGECRIQTEFFYSIYKVIQIPSFGFNAYGKFEISLQKTNLTNVKFFMLPKENQPNKLNFSTLLSTCNNDLLNENISINYSSTFQNDLRWSGTILTKNIYTAYIVNCDNTKSQINVEYHFSNPNSLLDYRDEKLPEVHMILVVIYSSFFIIWCLNGYFFSSFRIPIHTIFCIHPLLKVITLVLIGSVWNDKKKIEDPSMTKEIIAHICDFINYGLLMSAITYVSAGLCIYRERFCFTEHAEIILSSVMITLCLVLFPFIHNIVQSFIVLIITCFGALWHIQLDAIFLIISLKIREEMKDQQIVNVKISMSQKYVISSLICLMTTVLLHCLSLTIDHPAIVSVTTLEVGLVIENIINLIFFLFRPNYAGEKALDAHIPRNKKRIVHVKQMITPFGPKFALFERKEL